MNTCIRIFVEANIRLSETPPSSSPSSLPKPEGFSLRIHPVTAGGKDALNRCQPLGLAIQQCSVDKLPPGSSDSTSNLSQLPRSFASRALPMSSHHKQSEAVESPSKSRPAPPRPARSRKGSLLDSPTAAKSGSLDALRFQLDEDPRLSIGSTRHNSSSVSRRIHGIPTPPYSETTSSAGGSAGRPRKDSQDAFASAERASPDRFRTHLPLSRLEAPSTVTAFSRSPSSASASTHTGSETVGARSPNPPQTGSFSALRRAQGSESTMSDSYSSPRPSTSTGSVSRLTSVQRYRDTADSNATDSPSAPRASSSLSTTSPGGRRKRRSEMHERNVNQIRSESRIGFGDGDDDDEEREVLDERHPFPNSSQHKYSPRKSITLSVSTSRHDESNSIPSDSDSPSKKGNLRELEPDTPLTPFLIKSPRYSTPDEVPSGSMRRLSRTTGRASGRYSLDDRSSPNNAPPSRSPMPAEFRLPDREIRRAYRAAHQRRASTDDSDGGDDPAASEAKTRPTEATGDKAVHSPRSTHGESLDGIQEEGVKNQPTQPTSEHRRRRYASDAAADEVTSPTKYDGRLGSQGSRISVDSSSAQRYLARASLQSTPSSSARRAARASEVDSPSEEARARKISSTSSSRSQKSSSSASELHRAASRVSMRKQYGHPDLFSAETLPSSTGAGARAQSPTGKTERSSLTNSSDRSRPYQRAQDASLDNLRSQIDDLRVANGTDLGRRELRDHTQLGAPRSSFDLNSPALGSVRAQSVLGIQRTPNELRRLQHLHQYPSTDPQRARHDRTWQPLPDPVNSSDAANRIHELVSLRSGGASSRQAAPLRSATAMGTASETFIANPSPIPDPRPPRQGEEPAPIRNLAIRLSQYEALYSKVPSADPSAPSAAGPHTARTVELMGAIVRGTSTMWAELASMHPIATEGHLMGREGDAFTDAFGQLDEGLAFVNKLVLEQARAIQDLLFLLDRTEKERQAQFNQALAEIGLSPRSFSRMGEATGSADRNAHLLRRAASSVRAGSSMQTESPSPFTGFARGAERGGTLTASQIRSMTSLGYANTHSRSASELSPSSSAAQRRLDRLAVPSGRDGSLDSPLAARRSVAGRPFPGEEPSSAKEGTQMAPSTSSTSSTAKPAPGFTPRRPRLSNPSVSNATAEFHPSPSSVVASSPEASLHNGVSGRGEGIESEGSTIGSDYRQNDGDVNEFGRVTGGSRGGETVRRTREATIRGGGTRVVDTLASQLDSMRSSNESEREVLSADNPKSRTLRRHTINFHTATTPSPEGESRSPPPKLSQYGLTKSDQPPPRPPRAVQRPSEESIHSPRRNNARQQEQPSTPIAASGHDGDMGTPRQQGHNRGGYIREQDFDPAEGGAGSAFRSLGRTAARRVSRALGSSSQAQE